MWSPSTTASRPTCGELGWAVFLPSGLRLLLLLLRRLRRRQRRRAVPPLAQDPAADGYSMAALCWEQER